MNSTDVQGRGGGREDGNRRISEIQGFLGGGGGGGGGTNKIG
jgi:hypothetical protein